jgi:hypothetical protein
MKSLFVRKLYLWPRSSSFPLIYCDLRVGIRFYEPVVKTLSKYAPEVVEVTVGLSKCNSFSLEILSPSLHICDFVFVAMTIIQESVVEVLDAILSELKQSNKVLFHADILHRFDSSSPFRSALRI